MGARYAQAFQALRPQIMTRLVDVRGSIDQSFVDLTEDTARERFDTMLGRMQAYLESGDRSAYRSYLSRWMALRTGEGATAESVVHTVVAVGDVVVQIARAQLPNEDSTTEFVREVTRLNFIAARLIVENLADELARLTRRRTAPLGSQV
jgi:hypothetical protein